MQKTILLVDDDEEEYYIIKLALEMAKNDCRCIWASSLEEATELLKELQPDFVFIDINMPKHDGFCCLKHLKQVEKLHRAVFVIYSTHISEADRKMALQSGASYCIHKPENIHMLLDELMILLSNKTHCS
ncbi:response regulator [Longitalea luteola]|uniref:response regulator n=1 Tax=Longitalea luteola TaxID=2812563 RepID=UPI001A9582BE|nr:response regulator [Longitalea luteola]